MTKTEQHAILTLSLIMGLRLLGLFLVIPIFSLYAQQLWGATPALIGIAVSIYGLTQACCQIPFGMLSDYFGRHSIILIGLIIFILGSLLSGFTHSIYGMIVGRALQGAGAVGSTILALLADLTTEEQRSKAMAITGMTIGGCFSLALVLGPFLIHWFAIRDLFFVSTALGLIAILVLYYVPKSSVRIYQRNVHPSPTFAGTFRTFINLFFDTELSKLNCGIFLLHAIFTASFVVMPIDFLNNLKLPAREQWHLYLPTLLTASVITLICLSIAEKKQQVKTYFLLGIVMLTGSECLLALKHTNLMLTIGALLLFFTGFSLLEALLPSLVSRQAPLKNKGTALGIFSCVQFLGIFVGGMFAGCLYGQFNLSIVYAFCVILALFWLFLAFLMQPPHYLVTQMLRLQQSHWNVLASRFEQIPGMVEVSFIAEEGIAYLKMERGTVNHPDLIRLKEQLS